MTEEQAQEALLEALEVGQEAAELGFDWPDAWGPLAKVREEVEELEETLTGDEGRQRQREELGDLLFSVVNLARHLGVEPAEALRQTTAKFQARFEKVRRWGGLDQEGGGSAMSLEELEALWKRAKEEER